MPAIGPWTAEAPRPGLVGSPAHDERGDEPEGH